MKNTILFRKRIIWLILFSIAMGYLETAVVVYLREIYYPNGFSFPLVAINAKDIIVELGREAATIIMLLSVGILSGKTKAQRFACFLLSFAVWDIFYYVFLKLLLGWPESLMTNDILFLIPFPWIGPVWAPILLSITMIFLSFSIIRIECKNEIIIFHTPIWICWLAGSLIVIYSFCENTIHHLNEFQSGSLMHYIPISYKWWLFALGDLIILYGILRLYLLGYNKKGKLKADKIIE